MKSGTIIVSVEKFVKFKKRPVKKTDRFGGECEIRTHGGFPHHQFSRLAP